MTQPVVRTITRLSNPGGTIPQRGSEAITTCKLCRHGLYYGQPRVWLTQPVGLSHHDCAERAGLLHLAIGSHHA